MRNKIVVISSSQSSSTGVGRHALSLLDDTEFDTLISTGTFKLGFLDRFRNLQNILFFLFTSLLSVRFKDQLTISTSVVCPFKTKFVHFSSCHKYSLFVIGKHPLLKLILRPINFFYLALELIHYRNKGTVKVFLSNMELQRFQQVYGPIHGPHFVARPQLRNSLLPKGRKPFGLTSPTEMRACFISYNAKLKGLDTCLEVLKKCDYLHLIILGDISGFEREVAFLEKQKRCKYLGRVPITTFDFSRYAIDTFLYPSKLDSHGFVLEEAFRMGLIPLFSTNVGFGEFFQNYASVYELLCFNTLDPDNVALLIDRLVLSGKWQEICASLEAAREDWENRSVRDEIIAYSCDKIF